MLLEGETVMNIGSDFFKLQKIKQASFFETQCSNYEVLPYH